jgi:hypothetical protein
MQRLYRIRKWFSHKNISELFPKVFFMKFPNAEFILYKLLCELPKIPQGFSNTSLVSQWLIYQSTPHLYPLRLVPRNSFGIPSVKSRKQPRPLYQLKREYTWKQFWICFDLPTNCTLYFIWILKRGITWKYAYRKTKKQVSERSCLLNKKDKYRTAVFPWVSLTTFKREIYTKFYQHALRTSRLTY